ncbi:MAG: methionyl-tRNA formyltransferase [Longicatena sp.]
MNRNINIVFMGTPDIAAVMLKRLLSEDYNVIGVVSQPDKKVGRKQIVQMSSVKEVAIEHHICVYQPRIIRDDYQALLKLPIDLIVTCAYGQFIPDEVLAYPTYGSINVHASLLPKLRGGAPIHKAIINGDKTTGISIMRMVKKMDAGAVMAQSEVVIDDLDTMGSLYQKLAIAGADLLATSICKIVEGRATFIEQNEADATFAYTIGKEEEHIDFDADVKDVYNHIRGLIPTPCGYAIVNGKKMKFHKVRMIETQHDKMPGCIVGMMLGGYGIACLGGFILVDEVQMEGKSKGKANDFYNGAGKALIGKQFEKFKS